MKGHVMSNSWTMISQTMWNWQMCLLPGCSPSKNLKNSTSVVMKMNAKENIQNRNCSVHSLTGIGLVCLCCIESLSTFCFYHFWFLRVLFRHVKYPLFLTTAESHHLLRPEFVRLIELGALFSRSFSLNFHSLIHPIPSHLHLSNPLFQKNVFWLR